MTFATDALGQTSYFEYDSLGRRIVEKLPYQDNQYSTTKYYYTPNGQLSQIIDPEGYITRQYYDSRSFVTAVEKPINASESNITKIEYDREGNTTRIMTGLNSWNDTDYAVNSYDYDQLNRLISSTDNSGAETNYQYDNNSNLTRVIDRNQISTFYTYDGLNRLTKKANSKDRDSKAIEVTYDLLGNVASISNEAETTRYTYDDLGRPEIIDYTNGIKQYYTYDKADRISSLIIKQSSVNEIDLSYSYDRLGRLTAVKDKGKTFSYTYDPIGRLIAEQNGVNGIKKDYSYYSSGNIKSLNHFSGTELLKTYAYKYDKRGNQIEKVEGNETTSYYYDSLSRLKTVIEPDNSILDYQFDDLNNIKAAAELMKLSDGRTLIKETHYLYDRNSRLLLAETKVGKQEEQLRFTYDQEGNQITKQETFKYSGSLIADKSYTYQYNGFNQLERVIDANQIIEYSYNGQGLRTKKDFIDHAIQYYYDRQNIILETDQDNRITARNIRGNKLIYREADFTHYYLHNAHGDVTALTDNFGNIIKDYDYNPYGVEEKDPVNNFGKYATISLWQQEIETIDNPFRYCGEYYDQETGSIYLRARYYDPVLGRFTQEDSYKGNIADPLSLNVYSYCANNPIKYIDFSGHEIEEDKDILSDEDYQIMLGLTALYEHYKNQGDLIKADAMHIEAVDLRNKYKGKYENSDRGGWYKDNYEYADFKTSRKLYVRIECLNESKLWKHGGEATPTQKVIIFGTQLIPDGGVGLFFTGLDKGCELVDQNYNPGKVIKPNDVYIYVGTSAQQPTYGEEFYFRNGKVLYKYDQPQGVW